MNQQMWIEFSELNKSWLNLFCGCTLQKGTLCRSCIALCPLHSFIEHTAPNHPECTRPCAKHWVYTIAEQGRHGLCLHRGYILVWREEGEKIKQVNKLDYLT